MHDRSQARAAEAAAALVLLGPALAVPRPGTARAQEPPPCVTITEIMGDPAAVADAEGEWFEIANYGLEHTYDLHGWVVSDSSGQQSFVIDDALPVAPGAFLVLARAGDPQQNGGLVPDYVYGNALPLANTGDTILLRDPTGLAIDLVRYGPGDLTPGSARAASVGHPVLNDAPQRWYDATTPYGDGDRGTPGAPNEVYLRGPCQVDIGVPASPHAPPAPAPFLALPAPNPGPPPVAIRFVLPEVQRIRLAVHDVAGRTVCVLADGHLDAGRHRRAWDGRTGAGRRAAAGVYWIRLEAGNHALARPLTLRR